MPSINVDLKYFDHPKTVRLMGLLGKGADLLPIRLWIYTGKYHALSGRFTGYSTQAIETAIDWWGQKGLAVEALLSAGFLDKVGDNEYQVHDWPEHEGHLVSYTQRGKAISQTWVKRRTRGRDPPQFSPDPKELSTDPKNEIDADALYNIKGRGGEREAEAEARPLTPAEGKKWVRDLIGSIGQRIGPVSFDEQKRLRNDALQIPAQKRR